MAKYRQNMWVLREPEGHDHFENPWIATHNGHAVAEMCGASKRFRDHAAVMVNAPDFLVALGAIAGKDVPPRLKGESPTQYAAELKALLNDVLAIAREAVEHAKTRNNEK